MVLKKKILIVEDEKSLAHALKFKLESAGYTVDVENDGASGLATIKSKKFDLVLLDLVMPKVNGFGVLEELKKIKNSTPVIVLSNLGQDTDIATAKRLGAKDFLIKSDTQLEGIVDKVRNFA